MRYLGNNTNLVRDAVLSALNIVPSAAIYRTDTAAKVGGGSATLDGPYTGQHDTTIDVKIVAPTGGVARLSQPVFTGTGNGVIGDLSVDVGVAAQDFVLTLEDLGTQTHSAGASLQGATLVAVAGGTAGNAITVRIDHSALTFGDTAFSLQDDLKAGTNEYTGAQWDFGAVLLDAEGTIPASAPRLRLGVDPQIYRQYKQYKNGAYVYGFSPAPVRDIPKGSRVHSVSGSRSMTVSDGVTNESMTGIVTLYDTLSAIRDHSALVRVTSPIVNDRLPGGMGATELSVYTVSYPVSLVAAGGNSIKLADLPIHGSASSPTETLTIHCIDAPATGSETWSVRGDVSGVLLDATTNVAYADGGYVFKIPLPFVPGAGAAPVKGTITVEYVPNTSTSTPRASLPRFTAVKARLGAAAKNGTWSYTLSARPPAPCDSNDVQLEGGPSEACLGISTSGDSDVSITEASILIRLQRLKAFTAAAIRSNTSTPEQAAQYDIDWINRAQQIFADGVKKLSDQVVPPVWAATTVYTEDAQIESVNRNGYRFACTTPGTSGATEPTWSTTIDSTTTDGTVTWTCIGKTPFRMWDDEFAEMQIDSSALSGINIPTAQQFIEPTGTGTSYMHCALGDWFVLPEASMGDSAWLYQVTKVNGTDGMGRVYDLYGYNDLPKQIGAETSLVTGTGTGGGLGATLTAKINFWNKSSYYPLDAIATPGNGRAYKVTTAGTTGSTMPTWATDGLPFTDGGVTWTEVSGHDLTNSTPDAYFERYRSAMNSVLAAAGIDANFDEASAKGDGCWQDFNDSANWWVFDGSKPYYPIQTNHYYIPSIMMCSGDGAGDMQIKSTQEFGFGPKFACPELLEIGDKLIVTIDGIGGASTGQGYQPGDEFVLSMIHADPLPFTGGQTGTDTLTWSVLGSVAGRLSNYSLLTLAPPLYSDSGVDFRITPGGVPFALGDQYRFSVEGGQFQWRRDGGSWSESIDIADTALADGLTAKFQPGAAPSWKNADTWTFRAEAVNGVDGVRQPTDARLAWTGSTTIDVTPASAAAISCLLIGDHTIPADATITLTGSNDNFATTVLTQAIAWSATHIFALVTSNCARYRIAINRAGSASWLYLGDPAGITSPTGRNELGKLTKRVRLPGLTARRALGATIAHEALPQSSVDALLAMLSYACEFDERRFAIVPNDAEPGEVGLVEFDDASLELGDVMDFQPRDVGVRLTSLSMTLTPTP